MLMVYNNSALVVYVMKQTQYKTVKSEAEKISFDWHELRGLAFDQTFFPRIIREFDDGVDEKPMVYGGQ